MSNKKDYATGTVAVAPSPQDSGLTLELQTGEGARQPATPYFATAHPPSEFPTLDNAEKIEVTDVTGDVLTFTRAEGDTSAMMIDVGWRISNAVFEADLGPPGVDTSIPYNDDGDWAEMLLRYTFGSGYPEIRPPDQTVTDTQGYSFLLQAGRGNGTQPGGAIAFQGGPDDGDTATGAYFGGNGAEVGKGGDAYLAGGSGLSGDADGGSVILAPGTADGSGTDGEVHLQDPVTAALATLRTTSLTTTRIFTFPDAAGTIALTSDLADVVYETDTSTADMDFVLDEDDMASDSATKLATQQSIKAYVDDIALAVKQAIFPVGAYYVNYVDDTNPASLAAIGFGTWIRVEGRSIFGVDDGDADFDPATTGGHKDMQEHTHIQDSHNHTQNAHTHTQNAHSHSNGNHGTSGAGYGHVDSGSATSSGNFQSQNTTATNQNTTATNNATTATNQNAGTGDSGNLPPFETAYIFRRTA